MKAKFQKYWKEYLKSSLKHKISMGVYAALFFITIATCAQVIRLYNQQVDATGKNIYGYVLNMSTQVGQRFKRYYWLSQTVSQNSVFETKDAEKIKNYLNKLADTYWELDTILFVDSDGQFVSANSENPDGLKLDNEKLKNLPYKSFDWFNKSLKEETTDSEDYGLWGTFIEGVQYDPVSSAQFGKERLGTSYSVPVKSANGDVIGVLSIRANFKWVEDRVVEIYTSMIAQGVRHTEFFLANKEGQQLLYFDPIGQKNSTSIRRNKAEFGKKDLQKMGLAGLAEARAGQSGFMSGQDGFSGEVGSFVGYTTLDFDTMPNLGWSLIVNVDENALIGGLRTTVGFFLLAIIASFGLCVYLIDKLLLKVSTELVNSTGRLKEQSISAVVNSEKITMVSSELTSASHVQQEAVQKTMAALDQMTAMLSNTNGYVAGSLETANLVSDKTQSGRSTMEQMQEAMNRIQTANTEMEAMIKIIQGISEKTDVISNIVFNTKLLAFNASIEAARAGEHGKGFAVVAEEVGKLAQLSGDASQEIDELILKSEEQAKRIIENISDKIVQSESVTKEAHKTFEEISAQIEEMTSKVNDIRSASSEQELGIQQVNEAMKNIDNLTEQNKKLATDSDSLAQSSKADADRLNHIMQEVRSLVLGTDKNGKAVENLDERNVLTKLFKRAS